MTGENGCTETLDFGKFAETLRAACEKAWDQGADSVSYDPESRDFLAQPENPYRR